MDDNEAICMPMLNNDGGGSAANGQFGEFYASQIFIQLLSK